MDIIAKVHCTLAVFALSGLPFMDRFHTKYVYSYFGTIGTIFVVSLLILIWR